MHDLIQEMGQDIVFKSTDKLGERSRLWIAQDVSSVLENNKGTEAIEGIYLPWDKNDEDVHLRPDVFEEMRKLRLLKFYDASHYSVPYNKVYIDGDLKYLPNGLRYLHWKCYPGKSLPSNFKPQFLVELHMPHSKLEQLWDGVKKLGSLKHINLRGSELLTKIPDLSLAPKLESINLSDCRSLIHIPSLNFQATLDKSAYQCQQKIFYHSLLLGGFKNERTPGSIILSGCNRLTTLPKLCGNITNMDLSGTALQELPSSIESLENLLDLDLRSCANLKRLPKLPRNIEVLKLGFSGIEEISSSSIECLCSLRILSLDCSKLGSFPFLTGLCSLTELTLPNCNIREIPNWLGSLTSLTELDLYGNAFEGIPASIGMLYKLEWLDISNCENLRSLPASIGMLYKLERLDISNCENLQSLPESIGMLNKLKRLDISYCKNLRSLPELPLFVESVDANGCSLLEMVSTLRSTLTLGRWLDDYDGDNDKRQFSFLDCANLGKDAINNIFTEFLYKIFCTATTPQEVGVSRQLVLRYSTMEIPRWFNNQCEGSSITITLPPNWYNAKTFLGFVVSAVFRVNEVSTTSIVSLNCELHLVTNKDHFRVDVFKDFVMGSCLDHIVMWYKYFDHSKANFEKYQKASLEFRSDSVSVQRCGVRMLYLKDAVKESNDGSTANFES
ncbi:hypothetical protein UlMin_041336 [Ulmus minor]